MPYFSAFLGIDTSNYTTSVATWIRQLNKMESVTRPLPVASGSLGLSQSEALFHHTANLPDAIGELFNSGVKKEIRALGVSSRPRDIEGSYMPCFKAGVSLSQSLASILKINCHQFSHQAGHIAAAVYSVDRLDLLSRDFIAFHLSGGTTEAVVVNANKEKPWLFGTRIIAKSLDLKAGQAVDRAGKLLGLGFPSGGELDRLSAKSKKIFNIKPALKGNDCCLSGLENILEKMKSENEPDEDIAAFCIQYIAETVKQMLIKIKKEYPDYPVVFAGGVSRNSYLREKIEGEDIIFSRPEYSSDNAMGLALLAGMAEGQI